MTIAPPNPPRLPDASGPEFPDFCRRFPMPFPTFDRIPHWSSRPRRHPWPTFRGWIATLAALVLGFGLVTPAPLWADDDPTNPGGNRSISLEDAYNLAARHNPDLKILEERVTQAQFLIDKAFSLLYPTVHGNSRLGWATTNVNSFGANGGFVQSEEFNWTWTTTLAVGYRVNFRSIPLLAQARAITRAAENDATQVRRQLYFAVATVFYNAAQIMEHIRLAEEQLRRAEEFLRLAEVRVANEVDVPVSALRAKVEKLAAETQLHNAKASLRYATEALGFLIGVEPPFTIEPPTAPDAGVTAPEAGPDPLSTALRLRMDLLAAETRVQAVDHALTDNWVKWMPTIALEAAFTHIALEREGSFRQPTNIWSIGIVLDWAIFDGGLRLVEREELHSQRHEALFAVEKLKADIKSAVRRAELDLETAKSRLTLAAEQRDLAREHYDMVKRQFAEGLVDNTLLIDAQTTLANAETAVSIHRLDAQLAALRLAFETGTFDPRGR